MTEQEIKSEIKGSLLRLATEEKIGLDQQAGIGIYLNAQLVLSFGLYAGVKPVKQLTIKDVLSWAAYTFFKAKVSSFFYQKLLEMSEAYNIKKNSINVRIYLMPDQEPYIYLYNGLDNLGEIKIDDKGNFTLIEKI